MTKLVSPRAVVRIARRAFGGVASTLPVAVLLCGCGGDGKSDRVKLTERLGCSTSYVAGSTDAVGVDEIGSCEFRGFEITIVSFAGNGARNNYVCSTCGFTADTEDGAIESAARRLGGRFVAGNRYLVKVPNAAAEQAVRETLG